MEALPTPPPGPDLTVDAGAEKRFFIEMLTKDIELLPAVVDLVDNSVDGARSLHPDGQLRGQWVRITASARAFEIADNSGGISVETARHYAFRFGRAAGFTGVKRSVGQFGVGMKRAIFKLGSGFQVSSQHRGDDPNSGSSFTMNVDVAEWAEKPEWTFAFDRVDERLPASQIEEGGTTISVLPLHPSVSDDLNDSMIVHQLKLELQIRHQESLQAGLRLVLNGETLAASRPALQSSELIRPISRTFQVDHGKGTVDVRLYAGTVAAPKRSQTEGELDEGRAEDFQTPGDAGWYLFCNDRLLMVADKSSLTGWGSPAAAYHPQYRHFRGFVYLSADDASLLPWNTTKTAVDRDSLVFRVVQSAMKTSLVAVQAAINRAKNERARMEDEAELPAIVRAFADSPERPISELERSERMIVPEPPPRPQRVAPAVQVQRIQYTVEPERYQAAAKALGARSGSEVGRMTFDYFYDSEIS